MKSVLIKYYYLLSIFFLFSYSISMANEEAEYEVLHKNDTYEVRYYSDRLVVQIVKTNENKFFV